MKEPKTEETWTPKAHPEWWKKRKSPQWENVKKAIKKYIKPMKKEEKL